jgi:Flp pilus assembly protein TadB
MFGHEVGGRRAALVDAAAATLRDRHEAMAEVATQATTARLSAIVMAATPVVFGGLEAALDGRTRAALASPVGVIAIAVGLVLDAVGCWWLLRLSRVAGGHR